MMERLGKLLAHVPVDSHELGDLVTFEDLEDRVEAIEAHFNVLEERLLRLEQHDTQSEPPRDSA